MHIVHIKEPYGSLVEAEHDMAGIALLAFLFEVMLTSITTASTDLPPTLLIFSVQEAAEDHPHLDAIITALGRVKNNGTVVGTRGQTSPDISLHFPLLTCFCAGSSTVIPNFQLSDLVPSAKELRSFYRYVGSMTTPGCEQAVAWTLFHGTLPISSRQVRPTDG